MQELVDGQFYILFQSPVCLIALIAFKLCFSERNNWGIQESVMLSALLTFLCELFKMRNLALTMDFNSTTEMPTTISGTSARLYRKYATGVYGM